MSGYPYGGNPQYPPPQNQIYPQLNNPTYASPPGQNPVNLSYPGAPQYPQPYPNHTGFAYPGHPEQHMPPGQGYPGQPGQQMPPSQGYPGQSVHSNQQMPPGQGYPGQSVPSTQHMPSGQGYPGVAPTPTAPYGFGYPGGVSQDQEPIIDWVGTTPKDAPSLSDRAVVAGYEAWDNSPLWVIRCRFQGDLLPGKLAVKHHAAYVPWGGKENAVQSIEVLCAKSERLRWVEHRSGTPVPVNAVPGGNTASGETLYIGRAKEQGSLTPGKVHPSHKCMYISFAGKEVGHKVYEILCTV